MKINPRAAFFVAITALTSLTTSAAPQDAEPAKPKLVLWASPPCPMVGGSMPAFAAISQRYQKLGGKVEIWLDKPRDDSGREFASRGLYQKETKGVAVMTKPKSVWDFYGVKNANVVMVLGADDKILKIYKRGTSQDMWNDLFDTLKLKDPDIKKKPQTMIDIFPGLKSQPKDDYLGCEVDPQSAFYSMRNSNREKWKRPNNISTFGFTAQPS